VEGNLGNASAPRSLIVMVPLSSGLPQWLGFANSAMKASAFQAVVRALTRHKPSDEDDAVRESFSFPWITAADCGMLVVALKVSARRSSGL
jgi:hypothetical protein